MHQNLEKSDLKVEISQRGKRRECRMQMEEVGAEQAFSVVLCQLAS